MINLRNAMMGGKGDPMAVVGSAVGNGTNFCIFSGAFTTVPSRANGLTVTMWAKFTPATRGHFVTVGSDATGLSLGHGASSDNSANGNIINGLANQRWWAPTSTSISDGKWHHYGFSLGYRSHKIYVDGVGVGDGANPGWGTSAMNTLNSSSEVTLLGVCDGSEPRFLTGNVTRVCVYIGRTMSAAEIATDFALGMSGPDTNGLSHYYNGASGLNGQLIDLVGDIDLSPRNGAYVSSEKPSIGST